MASKAAAGNSKVGGQQAHGAVVFLSLSVLHAASSPEHDFARGACSFFNRKEEVNQGTSQAGETWQWP